MKPPKFLRNNDLVFEIPMNFNSAIKRYYYNFAYIHGSKRLPPPCYYWLRHSNPQDTHPSTLTVVAPAASRFDQGVFFYPHDSPTTIFDKKPLTDLYSKLFYFLRPTAHAYLAGNYLFHHCQTYKQRSYLKRYMMFEFGFIASQEDNNNNLMCKNCTYTVPPGYTMHLWYEEDLQTDCDTLYSPTHEYFHPYYEQVRAGTLEALYPVTYRWKRK